MGYFEEKLDDAVGFVENVAGKTLDTIGDVLEKVGDTVEAIASDPKKLAMVGLAIAFPGAAATIGQSFGLSGAAATVAGQTVINTAINGGDVEQAVKGALVTYVGAEVAGQVGEAAKTSGASEAIAKTVGQSAGQAVTAAAMGKDPLLALVAGGANVAAGIITQEIPGFSALPEAAQNAMRNAVAADMQGQDAIGAAASTLVNNAMGYAKNYAKVQADLAAKNLNALDANALAAIKDADATDLSNVVKAAETAQTYGTALDADDISAIAGLKDSSEVDTYVTDNIVNPAQAERAGFGTDVNAWEDAQELGFTTAKDFNQYEDFAEMYKDVFGEEGTPEEVKKYLPKQVKLQDTLDALKVYLGKREATADDIDRLDFDRDGSVDLDDVLNLQKYYLGKQTAVDPSDYWTKNATPEAALESMRAAYAAANPEPVEPTPEPVEPTPEPVEPTPDAGSIGDASDLPGMQDTGGDQLTNQDLADIVSGGIGDATLEGGAGEDTLTGGQDSVVGGEATTQGGTGADTIVGGTDTGAAVDDGTTDGIQEVIDSGQVADDGTTGGIQEVIDELPDTEPEPEPQCAEGFHWDGSMCVADDDTPDTTTTCPDGYIFDLNTQSCVKIGGTTTTPTKPATTPTKPATTPATTTTQQPALTPQSSSGLGLAGLLALMGAGGQQAQPTQPAVADTSGMVDIEDLLANPLQTDPRKLARQSKMATGGSIDDLLELLNKRS